MGDTRIGQVRIRTDTDDPLATRMRGDAALRALDLEPPGMPAHTILCIRSMADPLPGGLDLRSSHAPRATEWERAARNAINDALRGAVRVVDGPVPATAPAVLFADRAELLACAARDAAGGGGGWWWRDTIRGGLTWVHVIREWLRAPQYVPAALELLVRSGDAVPFVRALEPQQAIELLTNVLRVHALEPLARTIVASLAAQTARRTTATPAPPPPLRTIVDPTLLPSSASPEHRVFFTITLAVRRAPSIVRTETFAQHVTAWIAPTEPSAERRLPAGRYAGFQPAGHLEGGVAAGRDAGAPPRHTRASASPAPEHDSLPIHTEPAPPSFDIAPPNPQRATSTPEAPAPIPDTIHSEYAGLFFLLNVAIALGFYDPYGNEPSLDLDVFDFLAAVWSAEATPPLSDARADSKAEALPPHSTDPLWPLLAQLANRDVEDIPTLPDDILARVREALRLVVDHEEPFAFVVRRPGRIALSPAHLDVTFCLAAHPIEIRLAGLDRDPGWIPAAGRHVEFHFD